VASATAATAAIDAGASLVIVQFPSRSRPPMGAQVGAKVNDGNLMDHGERAINPVV
jgi:hypothetical protein